MSFIEKFRRTTNSVNLIPEIDGLRFLAILLVVIFHSQSVIRLNPEISLVASHSLIESILLPIYSNGWQGVELFFVISGFILGLPFAKHYIYGANKPALLQYYKRRLFRLEPPYIIIMTFYFLVKLITTNGEAMMWFKHYAASIFYLHNVTYGNVNYIVSVAWSLEIEVQFYLLAPFLAAIFKLSKNIRRISILALLSFFTVINFYYPMHVVTLYQYISFFLVGFLLVDLYLDNIRLFKNIYIEVSLGIIALLTILYLNHTYDMIHYFAYMLAIFVLYHLTLNYDFWKRIFSIKVISIIGGMCYSIYLTHTAMLSVVRVFSHKLIVTDSLILNTVLLSLVSLPIVLIFSAAYFYFVEKPFMKFKKKNQ